MRPIIKYWYKITVAMNIYKWGKIVAVGMILIRCEESNGKKRQD